MRHASTPNARDFSQNLEFRIECGADALVRAGPPGPAFSLMNQAHLCHAQADEGVGRGPGGPPHNKKSVALGIHAARVPRPASAV